MAESFSRSVLRIVIAQLSHSVGFDSIQSSSMEILTSVLERYLLHVGRTIHDYSEQRGETIPNLDDVWFAFRQMGISVADIVDYTKQMESVAFAHDVAQFPAPKVSNLGFPTSCNVEDLRENEHIPLHMPSMALSNLKQDGDEAQSEALLPKKDSFVIAKENPQNFSSDDDIYSAGNNTSDEYMSDDSTSYNPSKSRYLTKPEDIPMVKGTAPSSLISVPSVSELEDSRSFNASSRRTSVDKLVEGIENTRNKDKTLFNSKGNRNTQSNTETYSDVPWINPDKPNVDKRQPLESETHSTKDKKSADLSWLSEKKNINDVYDPGWLQEDDSSLVHLNKPPTPDVPVSSPPLEKKSWFSRDKQKSPDSKLNKPFSKKHGTSKHSKHKISPSSNTASHKLGLKPSLEKKHSHQKPHKATPVVKKPGVDEQIKARIEAAERLLHSAPVPPYIPSSPKSTDKKSFVRSTAKTTMPPSTEKVDRSSSKVSAENISLAQPSRSSASSKQETPSFNVVEDKHDRMNYASSKSMNDTINAVVSRATEECVRQAKEAEEADLMKFSHLVSHSSSSDSESDVSIKAEQMLQLQERGLQEPQPPSPDSSSLSSLPVDIAASPLMDSESNESVKLPRRTPDSHADKVKSKTGKVKHKKKSRHKDVKSTMSSSPKSHVKSKKNKSKQPSFVTTETISPSPVKMKVKLKPLQPKEPKLFDVSDDKDRIKVTHPSKPLKEEKQKSKDIKSSKNKEYKTSYLKSNTDTKRDTSEKDHSVGKIILKKSKSGDTKVVKPKIKEHARSPSPISNRANLPLPKLSAAVPVTSVTVTTKEKEKKKSKKEKKKKREREKYRDLVKERSTEKEKQAKDTRDKPTHQKESKNTGWDSRNSSRRESFESDVASPLVPKLTLKMGASDAKFVIKPNASSSKTSSSKKRPHPCNSDKQKPAKERKMSVECVKTMSESFAAAVERKVVTQTISVGPVGVYEDDDGNKIWICPGCNKPDDGSPMIGCDACDDWYHWPCVGITEEPPDDVDWYCPRCRKRQQQAAKGKVANKKKKKK